MPSWDGSPETWDSFSIEVDVFIKQEPKWKEAQQVAKLLGALRNQGKDLHAALSESERDKIVTKESFKQFLRGHLLETAGPELGRNLRAWQKLRRQPKEGMRLYILRHRQLLSKLERSVNDTDVGKMMRVKLRSLIDAAKSKIVLEERTARIKEQLRRSRADNVHGKTDAKHSFDKAQSETGSEQG